MILLYGPGVSVTVTVTVGEGVMLYMKSEIEAFSPCILQPGSQKEIVNSNT